MTTPFRPPSIDYITRLQTATLVSVTTRRLSDQEKEWMGGYAALTHQLGGEFVHLHGRSVARAIVQYVHESFATEVMLCHRHSTRRLPGGTTSEVIRSLSGVDVHILRTEAAEARLAG